MQDLEKVDSKRPYKRRTTEPKPVDPIKELKKDNDALQGKIAYLETLAEEYRCNAQSAYEQLANLKKEHEAMKVFYNKTLAFCNNQVASVASAISLATKGEF